MELSKEDLAGIRSWGKVNPPQHATCEIFVASHIRGPYRDPKTQSFGRYDLTDSVTSCTTEETFNGQTANFSLVLKRPWHTLIFPGDWVSIYFSSGNDARAGFGVYKDPESRDESIRSFMGFIDAVRVSTEVSPDGTTRVRATVSCSGINKAFDKTNIYYNPELSAQSRFGSFLPGLADLMQSLPLQGTPATIPRAIALAFLGHGGQFLIPDSYPTGVGTPSERQARLNRFYQASLDLDRTLGIANVRGATGVVNERVTEFLKRRGAAGFGANSIASIIDFFSYVEDFFVDGLTQRTANHDLTGSVFSNMVEHSNPIMNECFFSLRPEQEPVTGSRILGGDRGGTDEWGKRPRYVPALVIRERPFGWHDWVLRLPNRRAGKAGAENSDFRFGNVFFSDRDKPASVPILQAVTGSPQASALSNALTQVKGRDGFRFVERVKMRSEDIRAETLGMSDNDHYNFWTMASSSLVIGPSSQKYTLIEDGLMPMFLAESIKRYGLRVRELQTKFIFRGGQDPDSRKVQDFLVRCLLAHDYWYQHAPWYRAGTITGRGIPKARVGMVLDVEGYGREESFYLEGVSMVWTHSEMGSGTLMGTYTVTRGQPSGFSDPSKRFNYAPPDAVQVFVKGVKGELLEKERKIAVAQSSTTSNAPNAGQSTTRNTSQSAAQRQQNAPLNTTQGVSAQELKRQQQERKYFIREKLIASAGDTKEALFAVEAEALFNPLFEGVTFQEVESVKQTMNKTADAQKMKQEEAKQKLSDDDLTAKIRKLIETTSIFESSGNYDYINKNDGGTGISYGFIQFNQVKGSLPQMFKLFFERDPVTFRSIFGSWESTLLNEALLRSNRTVLNSEDLYIRLRQAAQVQVFRDAQLDLGRTNYFEPTVPIAKEFGLKSERAFAMLFDTAIQNGFRGRDGVASQLAIGLKKAKIALGRETVTEKEFLTYFAAHSDIIAVKKVREKLGFNVKRPFRREKILASTLITDNDFFSSAAQQATAAQSAIPRPLARQVASQVGLESLGYQSVQREDRQRAGAPPWTEQKELQGVLYDPIVRPSSTETKSGDISYQKLGEALGRSGKS